jgi:hypothetical protein
MVIVVVGGVIAATLLLPARWAVSAEGRFNEVLMNAELKVAENHFTEATRAVSGANATSPPDTGPDFETLIAQARQTYLDAYRSGKGIPEAAMEFGRLLAKKDAVLLWNELLVDGVTGQAPAYARLARLDGGVVPGARRQFNDWVTAINEKADNGGGDFTQRMRRAQLMGAFPAHQTAYLVARNWAELERAGIELQPARFAWMLVQRYPTPTGADVAQPNLRAMIELFGEESLIDAAKRLLPLPRDERGSVRGVEKVGIEPPANVPEELAGSMHVYSAWLTLIRRDNPNRAFLIDVPDLSQPHYFNPTKLAFWALKRDEYRRLLIAYGQERVDHAAQRCAKDGGNVENVLAATDLDAYLRFTLAQGEKLDTAEAIEARVKELTAHSGEAKVREVATQVRDAQVAGKDLKEFGAGLGDACSAIVTTLKPLVSNNPWYRAWARFPVGSKAVYRSRDKTELVYELKSISPQSLTVLHTQLRPGATPTSEEMEFRAAFDPEQFANNGSYEKTFALSVHYSGYQHRTTSLYMTRLDPTPESFELGGQSLECTKRIGVLKSSLDIAWMCDDVPGGMVEIVCSQGGRVSQVLALERFEGKPAESSSSSAPAGACLNCAAPLAAAAQQCETCHIAIGPTPEMARYKAEDIHRQLARILGQAPATPPQPQAPQQQQPPPPPRRARQK